MTDSDIRSVLEELKRGDISVDEAERTIAESGDLIDADGSKGYSEVDGYARVDTDRERRTGVPEAVLADGKSTDEILGIAREYLEQEGHLLLTRVDEESKETLTDFELVDESDWHPRSRLLVLRSDGYSPPERDGNVGVVTAGTSDIPAAEEAAVTAREMGCDVETVYDVGVAGVHRLLGEVDRVGSSDAVVVAAGREGALPTVVAGLVDAPVIGLPVSVGYGYGGEGEAALMGMLQSCSVLSLVNIDAGFVAGAQAAQIARD